MRKFLASALAALTFGGAIAVSAAPAQAERYYGHYRDYDHHHGGDTAAAAVVAGIAGLAIGAALSDGGHRTYYERPYYGSGYSYGYYDGPYYAPPRICIARDRVWDPYIGRWIIREHEYRC